MTVVAITGTPAAGKTTVARLVAKRLEWIVIGLNEIAHERELFTGYDEGRKTHVVDLGRIRKAVSNIEARDMIIESHYAHEIGCDVVVVLRASPGEIRERGRKKGWDSNKTEENVMAEIMDVCKQEALERGKPVFEVDTTGKTPAKVAGEVVRIIRRFKSIRKD